MRLSDLLRLEVIDAEGRDVGRVHDVRFVGDGRAKVPEWQIEGFIAGKASLGHRLGYLYGDVKGPKLLASLVRRRARHAVYVRWDDVARLEPRRLVLSKPAHELKHPSDQPGERR